MADYCVHWFRLAHDRLPDDGRAGLVGTNSIRQNESREASLDVAKDRGDAFRPWSFSHGVAPWLSGSCTIPIKTGPGFGEQAIPPEFISSVPFSASAR